MEHGEATGLGRGAPPQADRNAEDWLPGVPGVTPAWATSLEMELHSNLVLSEEQRLQTSRELVDLQIATHRLQAQHEAELFALRSEVLWLESRVLELELQRRPGQGRGHEALKKAQPKDCRLCEAEQQKLRQSLLGGQEHQPRDPEPTLGQQRVLEAHVVALGRQLQGAREEARTARQRLATHAVALSTCQGQLCHAEAENSRLQLQLKRLNEEYAARLQRCARDAAHYADGAGRALDAMPLRTFLEATLEDIRVAHRNRESQLARAAHVYRKRLADLSHRHEELLATHRPPVTAGARGHGAQPPAGRQGKAGDEDPGAPSPADQGSVQQGKPRVLRMLPFPTEASQGETLESQRHHPEAQGAPIGAGSLLGTSCAPPPCRGLDAASWAQIHQKLQDFSHGTQAELERERAQLLVRATVAEEQLAELQEYVDQHLFRYKQEILRLRKRLDTGEPCKAKATSPAKPRHPRAGSR